MELTKRMRHGFQRRRSSRERCWYVYTNVFMNRMRKVGGVWRVQQLKVNGRRREMVGSGERGTRLGEVGRGRVKRGPSG